MKRDYYSGTISSFLVTQPMDVFKELAKNNNFSLEQTQRDAWLEEIGILKISLVGYDGSIYFEYSIPRMGKRIDVVLLIGPIIFVIEFKVGEREYLLSAVDQVVDYSLDLLNFHETSHNKIIAPILVSTKGKENEINTEFYNSEDRLLIPNKCNSTSLTKAMKIILNAFMEGAIDPTYWEQGRYSPTPTIIEAAMALYNGHSVKEISRSDASAINLGETSDAISEIIRVSSEDGKKSICFVTGVPGAGKTLVGLNIATNHIDSRK